MAQLRGRVVERRPDGDMAAKDAMSKKYTGQTFSWRYSGGVILVVEVERARYQKIPLKHVPA